MAKYCDPKDLERTWLMYMMAKKYPSLESLREDNSLWVKQDKFRLEYCVPSGEPYCFISNDGFIKDTDVKFAYKASFAPLDLPMLRKLAAEKFTVELPVGDSWIKLSKMVEKTCTGISSNFRPSNPDEKHELIHDALAQILSKIQRGCLYFTPGKAPPFNLLTTAIFRVMYSIKNKEKREKENRLKFMEKSAKACVSLAWSN